MTTKKELDDKYDADLAELQKNCPHTKKDWFEEVWAPGHSLGSQALVCLDCNKTLDRRTMGVVLTEIRRKPPKQ